MPVSETVLAAEAIIWSGVIGALTLLVREVRDHDLAAGGDDPDA